MSTEKKANDSHEKIEKSGTENKKMSKKDKLKQNYLSIIILLVGLLAGSIFVDVADLIKGDGVSQKRLSGKDVFEYADKTWVAYPDPIVNLTVVNDENCKECSTDGALVALRSAIPTISPTTISSNSDEGQKLIKKSESKSIPVLIFDKSIEKTEIFSKIQNVLTQKDNIYVLDNSVLGITGKYTESPTFESKNQTIYGNPEAKVALIEFSDFQCPYCKAFYDSLDKLLNVDGYKDKVKLSFKNLPLDFHPNSNKAAMAAECAGEQGKFWEMYSTLFSKQAEWQDSTDLSKFKSYALQLKLDSTKFNQCLDSNKFQADIDADKSLAKQYNINGTPAVFINDEFISGAMKYEDLKAKIDALLAK